MPAERQKLTSRVAAAAALVAAIGAILLVFGTSGSTHVLHAEFRDAGQLVTGDQVRVGGQPIGQVTSLGLTRNGLADVTLSVDDSAWPLHRGTTVTIRLASLAGVANRYLALVPGDAAQPALPSGGTIGLNDTYGVVDFDQLLNSFTPQFRSDFQGVLRGYAESVRGVAADGNQAIHFAPPAFSQYAELFGQIVSSPPAFRTLLHAGSQLMAQLAADQGSLHAGLAESSTALGAIADEHVRFADLLHRAPATLAAADATLAGTRAALVSSIRPGLRAFQPVAAPLAALLRILPAATANTVPALHQLRDLLPSYDRALTGLPSVAEAGVPALAASARSLAASLSFFTGLREYGPDLIAGDFGAIGGNIYGTYDANGHYGRIALNTSPIGVGGAYGATYPTTSQNAAPPEDGLRLHLWARCPGGGDDPAFDKSNPFIQTPAICNPKDDLP